MTAPDWGQDHLSSEAIAAFVDGELAPGPYARAVQHLRQCPDCDAQVNGQGQASAALRTADCPNLSSAFLSTLRSIPQEADLPPPPAGLAMTPDGELVSVLRPEDLRPEDLRPEHLRSASTTQRRLRLGTGVAVSGLALGALAFSAPAAAPSIPMPTPALDRGVPGAPALGGSPGILDARLQLGSSSAPAAGTTTRRMGGFDR